MQAGRQTARDSQRKKLATIDNMVNIVPDRVSRAKADAAHALAGRGLAALPATLPSLLAPVDDAFARAQEGETVSKLRSMLSDERRRCEEVRSLLSTERARFDEERDGYAAAVSMLTQERDDAASSVVRAREEAERVKDDLRSLRRERDSLLQATGEQAAQSRQLLQAERQVSSLSSDNESLRAAVARLEASRAGLEERAAAREAEAAGLRAEIESLRESLSSESAARAAAVAQASELSERAECLLVGSRVREGEVDEARRAVVEARDAARCQLASLSDELAAAAASLAESEAALTKERARRERERAEADRLREELSDSAARAAAAEAMAEDVTAQLSSAALQMADQARQLSELRSGMQRLASERDTLSQDLASVRAYAEKMLRELAGATEDLRRESDSCLTLRSQVSALERDRAAAEEEAGRQRSRADRLVRQVEELGGSSDPAGGPGPLQRRIEAMNEELKAIPALRAESDRLRSLVSELSSESDGLRARLREAEGREGELRRQKEENETLRAALTAARRELRTFEASVSEVEEDLAAAYKDKMASAARRHDELVRHLESRLSDLSDRLASFERERSESDKKMTTREEGWSEERAAYEARVTSLAARCEELASLLAEASRVHSEESMEDSREGMGGESPVAAGERDRLRAELDSALERLSRREAEHGQAQSALRSRLYAAEDERDKAARSLEQVQAELTVLADKCSMLEEGLARLRAKGVTASAAAAAAAAPRDEAGGASDAPPPPAVPSREAEPSVDPAGPTTPAPAAAAPTSAGVMSAPPHNNAPKRSPAWVPRVAKLAQQRQQARLQQQQQGPATPAPVRNPSSSNPSAEAPATPAMPAKHVESMITPAPSGAAALTIPASPIPVPLASPFSIMTPAALPASRIPAPPSASQQPRPTPGPAQRQPTPAPSSLAFALTPAPPQRAAARSPAMPPQGTAILRDLENLIEGLLSSGPPAETRSTATSPLPPQLAPRAATPAPAPAARTPASRAAAPLTANAATSPGPAPPPAGPGPAVAAPAATPAAPAEQTPSASTDTVESARLRKGLTEAAKYIRFLESKLIEISSAPPSTAAPTPSDARNAPHAPSPAAPATVESRGVSIDDAPEASSAGTGATTAVKAPAAASAPVTIEPAAEPEASEAAEREDDEISLAGSPAGAQLDPTPATPATRPGLAPCRSDLAERFELEASDKRREVAACRIQATWRGHVARREAARLREARAAAAAAAAAAAERAAAELAERERARAEAQAKALAEERNAAAARIQRSYRGLRFRARLAALAAEGAAVRRAREEAEAAARLEALQTSAARSIQRCWRAFVLGRRVRALAEGRREAFLCAAVVIQRAWRNVQLARALRAAARVAAEVRSAFAAAEAEAQREVEAGAVAMISRAWRVFMLRRRLRALAELGRDVAACREVAAMVLQQAWRRRRMWRRLSQVAREARDTRAAEQAERERLAEEAAIRLETESASASSIQRSWRGMRLQRRARALAGEARAAREAAAAAAEALRREEEAARLRTEEMAALEAARLMAEEQALAVRLREEAAAAAAAAAAVEAARLRAAEEEAARLKAEQEATAVAARLREEAAAAAAVVEAARLRAAEDEAARLMAEQEATAAAARLKAEEEAATAAALEAARVMAQQEAADAAAAAAASAAALEKEAARRVSAVSTIQKAWRASAARRRASPDDAQDGPDVVARRLEFREKLRGGPGSQVPAGRGSLLSPADARRTGQTQSNLSDISTSLNESAVRSPHPIRVWAIDFGDDVSEEEALGGKGSRKGTRGKKRRAGVASAAKPSTLNPAPRCPDTHATHVSPWEIHDLSDASLGSVFASASAAASVNNSVVLAAGPALETPAALEASVGSTSAAVAPMAGRKPAPSVAIAEPRVGSDISLPVLTPQIVQEELFAAAGACIGAEGTQEADREATPTLTPALTPANPPTPAYSVAAQAAPGRTPTAAPGLFGAGLTPRSVPPPIAVPAESAVSQPMRSPLLARANYLTPEARPTPISDDMVRTDMESSAGISSRRAAGSLSVSDSAPGTIPAAAAPPSGSFIAGGAGGFPAAGSAAAAVHDKSGFSDATLSEGVRQLLMELVQSPAPTRRQMNKDGDRLSESARASLEGGLEDVESGVEVMGGRGNLFDSHVDASHVESVGSPKLQPGYGKAGVAAATLHWHTPRLAVAYTAMADWQPEQQQQQPAAVLERKAVALARFGAPRDDLYEYVPPARAGGAPPLPAGRPLAGKPKGDGLPRKPLGFLGGKGKPNAPSQPIGRGFRSAPGSMDMAPHLQGPPSRPSSRGVGPQPTRKIGAQAKPSAAAAIPAAAALAAQQQPGKGWNPRDAPSPVDPPKRPASAPRQSAEQAFSLVLDKKAIAAIVARLEARRSASLPRSLHVAPAPPEPIPSREGPTVSARAAASEMARSVASATAARRPSTAGSLGAYPPYPQQAVSARSAAVPPASTRPMADAPLHRRSVPMPPTAPRAAQPQQQPQQPAFQPTPAPEARQSVGASLTPAPSVSQSQHGGLWVPAGVAVRAARPRSSTGASPAPAARRASGVSASASASLALPAEAAEFARNAGTGHQGVGGRGHSRQSSASAPRGAHGEPSSARNSSARNSTGSAALAAALARATAIIDKPFVPAGAVRAPSGSRGASSRSLPFSKPVYPPPLEVMTAALSASAPRAAVQPGLGAAPPSAAAYGGLSAVSRPFVPAGASRKNPSPAPTRPTGQGQGAAAVPAAGAPAAPGVHPAEAGPAPGGGSPTVLRGPPMVPSELRGEHSHSSLFSGGEAPSPAAGDRALIFDGQDSSAPAPAATPTRTPPGSSFEFKPISGLGRGRASAAAAAADIAAKRRGPLSANGPRPAASPSVAAVERRRGSPLRAAQPSSPTDAPFVPGDANDSQAWDTTTNQNPLFGDEMDDEDMWKLAGSPAHADGTLDRAVTSSPLAPPQPAHSPPLDEVHGREDLGRDANPRAAAAASLEDARASNPFRQSGVGGTQPGSHRTSRPDPVEMLENMRAVPPAPGGGVCDPVTPTIALRTGAPMGEPGARPDAAGPPRARTGVVASGAVPAAGAPAAQGPLGLGTHDLSVVDLAPSGPDASQLAGGAPVAPRDLSMFLSPGAAVRSPSGLVAQAGEFASTPLALAETTILNRTTATTSLARSGRGTVKGAPAPLHPASARVAQAPAQAQASRAAAEPIDGLWSLMEKRLTAFVLESPGLPPAATPAHRPAGEGEGMPVGLEGTPLHGRAGRMEVGGAALATPSMIYEAPGGADTSAVLIAAPAAEGIRHRTQPGPSESLRDRKAPVLTGRPLHPKPSGSALPAAGSVQHASSRAPVSSASGSQATAARGQAGRALAQTTNIQGPNRAGGKHGLGYASNPNALPTAIPRGLSSASAAAAGYKDVAPRQAAVAANKSRSGSAAPR